MFPALYAILEPSLVPLPVVQFAENLAAAGVRLVQLRDKRATGAQLFAESRELTERLVPGGVKLIVNDRPDVAAMAGASGVHLGQQDLPVEDARRVLGLAAWVGVSTHNWEQFCEAATTSADYIAVGPIFPTASKENPDPVVGLAFLRRVRELTEKPIVAIGGITLDRAEEVFRAGADSVAVIRDLLCVADPAGRARDYLRLADQARTKGRTSG